MTRDVHDLARRRTGLSWLFAMGPKYDVRVHDLKSPRWTLDPITIAYLSDLHPMRPWVTNESYSHHVEEVNSWGLDMIVLGGDFTSAGRTPGFKEPPEETAKVLSGLEAPLGVHAVLGNHDWIDDELAPEVDFQTSRMSQALTEVGYHPLLNGSRRLTHHGQDFWLVGFDSQWAPRRIEEGQKKKHATKGRHDPEAAYREVPPGAPSILLAHEPDYFVEGDPRSVLQISGHTHAGQANFFGWRPFTPSAYPTRYSHGHVEELGRHLVVSAGCGYTHVPARIAAPPEITVIRLSHPES